MSHCISLPVCFASVILLFSANLRHDAFQGIVLPRRAVLSAGVITYPDVLPCSAAVKVPLSQIVLAAGQDLERTDLSDYEAMRDDLERTAAFEAAIQKRITAGGRDMTVLDIGTGPFALLAIMAARAGAKLVYAIEKSPSAASMARRTVKEAGFENRVKIIEGDSTRVQLPERVDLIVSEIIGNIATGEGVVTTITDARKRFLKDSAGPQQQMIPSCCQTLIAPVSYKYHDMLRAKGPEFLRPFQLYSQSRDIAFLAEPQELERFDYTGLKDYGIADLREVRELTFQVSQRAAETGGLSGFACWPRVVVDDELTIDLRGKRSHWNYIVALATEQPLPLQPPAVVSLRSEKDVSEVPYRYILNSFVTM